MPAAFPGRLPLWCVAQMTRFQRALSVAVPATAVAGYGLFASLSDPLPSWLAEPWVPYLAGLSLLLMVIAAAAWALVLVILLGRVARWVWTGKAPVQVDKSAGPAAVLTIGEVQVAQFPNGGEFFLPLKVGPKQHAECRVTLTVSRVGGEKTEAASYVLKTEHAIEQGDKRVGRVTLDDAFKRFEIMSCRAGSDTFLIEAEAGDCWIPRDSYLLTITITGAGPAQTREYILQDEGSTLRICSAGLEKDARRLRLQAA
jgi:hypothetical protein